MFVTQCKKNNRRDKCDEGSHEISFLLFLKSRLRPHTDPLQDIADFLSTILHFSPSPFRSNQLRRGSESEHTVNISTPQHSSGLGEVHMKQTTDQITNECDALNSPQN